MSKKKNENKRIATTQEITRSLAKWCIVVNDLA
jgi:hypothetical protein